MRKVVGRVKKTVMRVVALDLIFLLLLIVSGAFSGFVSEMIYITAFLLPFLLFLWLKRGEAQLQLSLGMHPDDIPLLLALIAPTIAITVGLSALTSLLASLVGIGGTEPLSGSVFELIILHALLPAVLEEALFRYIPLTLIAPHSRRSAVLISAILFAAAHCDLATMPYAFVAGILFAIIDLACGSILPSVILHLLNNIASVLWLWDVSAPVFRLPFVITVAALALVSIALVVIFRARYAKKCAFLTEKCDKITTVREVWVFFAACMALALGALF